MDVQRKNKTNEQANKQTYQKIQNWIFSLTLGTEEEVDSKIWEYSENPNVPTGNFVSTALFVTFVPIVWYLIKFNLMLLNLFRFDLIYIYLNINQTVSPHYSVIIHMNMNMNMNMNKDENMNINMNKDENENCNEN